MTVKGGLLALSALSLVSLVMLVSSPDEAYRWVQQSTKLAEVADDLRGDRNPVSPVGQIPTCSCGRRGRAAGISGSTGRPG